MHPILGNRRRLAIYLAAWLLIGLLLAIGLRGGASRSVAAAFFLPLIVVYAFATLSAWYLCQAFPVGGPSGSRRRASQAIVVHALAAALASGVWMGLSTWWARGVDRLAGSLQAEQLLEEHRLLLFVVGALLFWLASLFHYMLAAVEGSRDAETRALELSLMAREAELKALRAQIDPHFIFNSLHSISALTVADPAAARRMCLLLADFLRETLRLGSNARIPLGDELALAERFLSIEQIRLGSRLRVAREAEPEAVACLVPPLLLQPLVENAVVHGIGQLVDGGTIRISASRIGPMLTITLENPCDPDRSRTRGVGLGLSLLRNRLTTQFGAYDPVRAAEESGMFRVTVNLPAITGSAPAVYPSG